MNRPNSLLATLLLALALPLSARAADSDIRLNTLGFLPSAPKQASIAAKATTFTITRADTNAVAFTGNATGPKTNPDTAEELYTAADALGRNPYARSFITGLGNNPPLHPHDRRGTFGTPPEPWPGYLVGGGWPKATDWKDTVASYQTNEIAINWNGALIYALAGFVRAPTSAPR